MTQQHDAPVSITSAAPSRSDDVHRRQVKYLLSMAVRTVCFVLAVVLSGPLRWVMVGGAVLLPYVAVVIANAADGRGSAGPDAFDDEALPQITAASAPPERRLQDSP